jgi:taurine dioxygenase
VVGLDLTQPVDEATFAAVYRAWNEHLVLRFRGKSLTDEQLVAFSTRFGELDDAPRRAVGDASHRLDPKILIVSNVVENGVALGGLGNSELVWHQDMSYVELPPKASLLHGIEVTQTGGETFFYNLYKAYETLPADLKARIQGLACKHDATRNSSGALRSGYSERYTSAERPGAVHPLVVKHPETGQLSLYLGRRPNAWIVGLSDTDSDQLLDQLWAHVENGPYHWAQQWQQGDLVIWDNRCTLHRRNTLDPGQRRHMHRTQVRDSTRPAAS